MYYSCRAQHCAAYYCNKQFHYGINLASDSHLQILQYADVCDSCPACIRIIEIRVYDQLMWSFGQQMSEKRKETMEDKRVQYFLWTKCRIEGTPYNNFILMVKCQGNKKYTQHFGRKISSKETNAWNRHVLLENFTFCWPCIMLWFFVNDQRDAQIFTMYLFLFLTLYMFRAHRAHHQERQIVSTQTLITVTLFRWPCRVRVVCRSEVKTFRDPVKATGHCFLKNCEGRWRCVKHFNGKTWTEYRRASDISFCKLHMTEKYFYIAFIKCCLSKLSGGWIPPSSTLLMMLLTEFIPV
jgi:hypothetical protein